MQIVLTTKTVLLVMRKNVNFAEVVSTPNNKNVLKLVITVFTYPQDSAKLAQKTVKLATMLQDVMSAKLHLFYNILNVSQNAPKVITTKMESANRYVNKKIVSFIKFIFKTAKVTKGFHRNLDLSDLQDTGCTVVYNEDWGHFTTNQHLTNIKADCKANTLVILGAQLTANLDDIDTAAVGNCNFALLEEEDSYAMHLLRDEGFGVFWGRRTNLCWTASTFKKNYFGQCQIPADYPDQVATIQFHILGDVGGFSVRTFETNDNCKYRKIILTC